MTENKCWECDAEITAKEDWFEDPRKPPLDEDDCLCGNCYSVALADCLEQTYSDYSEIAHKMEKIGYQINETRLNDLVQITDEELGHALMCVRLKLRADERSEIRREQRDKKVPRTLMERIGRGHRIKHKLSAEQKRRKEQGRQ